MFRFAALARVSLARPAAWQPAALSQRLFVTNSGHWGKFFGGKEAENVATASPVPPAAKPEAVAAPKVEEAAPVAASNEVPANAPLPEIEEVSDRLATAHRGNIPGSVKKMRELLHRLRGMPVDEAIRQMSFHHKHRRAAAIRAALDNARLNAVNTFNMDPTRLYVAEIKTNRSHAYKRLDIHARGKTGVIRHRFCNLDVVVKEWSSASMALQHAGRFGKQKAEQLKRRAVEREHREKWLTAVRAKMEASRAAAAQALAARQAAATKSKQQQQQQQAAPKQQQQQQA